MVNGRCKTLDQLGRGRSARILAVRGDDENSAARLHALGFLPGRKVRHRNTAPLGDPRAYELDGQKVSLRRKEAALVEIEEE